MGAKARSGRHGKDISWIGPRSVSKETAARSNISIKCEVETQRWNPTEGNTIFIFNVAGKEVNLATESELDCSTGTRHYL